MRFFWKNCIRLFELHNEKNKFLTEIVEKHCKILILCLYLIKIIIKVSLFFGLNDIVFFIG